MHICFILYVCEISTCTYGHWYAHDTTGCILHMHGAFVIHTSMYLCVCVCMCMYLVFIGAVSNVYVHVSLKYSNKYMQIRVDIHLKVGCISACMCLHFESAFMHICATFDVHICMYVNVFWIFIHSHLHSRRVRIFFCICLYLFVEYMHIQRFRSMVFIVPNRPPAGTGKSIERCTGRAGKHEELALDRTGPSLSWRSARVASNKTAHKVGRDMAARPTASAESAPDPSSSTRNKG